MVLPIHKERFKHPRCFIIFSATLKENDPTVSLQETELVEAKWVSREDLKKIETWDEWRKAIPVFFASKNA